MPRFAPAPLSTWLLALLLLAPGAGAQSPSSEPLRGHAVAPRVVEFGALPAHTPYVGPLRSRNRKKVNPEADSVLAALKRSPIGLTPAQLGQLTVDRRRGGFEALAPTLGAGFEGITQNGYIPSEPTVGAGPLNVFTAGNITVTVTDKNGSNRVETDGAAFFGAAPSEGAISDAQCYYDALRGRFVALCFTQGVSPNFSYFYLAISKTNDARGAWWLYQFDMTLDGATPTSNWSDYQGLGVSDDKIAMSAQQFSFSENSYMYQKIRVIDRALAYGGAPVSYVDFANFAAPPGGTSQDLFVTKVARNLSAGDNTIHCLNVRTNGGTRVTYRTITGPPSAPALSAGNLVTVGLYSPPPDAAQKGSSALVATNDCRPPDFYVRDGVLICAWHTSASIGGTVSAIRLFRMRTSDRAVLTDETYGAAGAHSFYPAATVDSVGTIFLGFGRSSTTEFPSAYVTGKRRVDAVIQPSALMKAGLTPTAQSRWGDYTGIDMEASAAGPGGSTAWYAGQWTKLTNQFGTWIAPMTFTYGQVAGTVLDDCDGSTGTTADRIALTGVTVSLKQGASTLATTVTGVGGAFRFGYLETGVYDVVVTPPAGGGSVDAIPGSGGNTQTKIDNGNIRVDLTNAQTSAANQFLATSLHPLPATASISPTSRNIGDPGFTLTVTGSNFTRCSVVRMDGSARATTYVDATQLTAVIPATDLTLAGPRTITVLTPAPGGGASNTQTFTVVDSGDVTPPVVTVTAPNGGESVAIGSIATLAWTAGDNVAVTLVDLLLSTTGAPGPFDPIATGISNTGSYDWTVAGPPTTDAVLQVVARDAAGNARSDVSDAPFSITGSASASAPTVTRYELAVWPNPVRRDARIGFAMPQAGRVRLSVLDLQGRERRLVAHREFDAGRHEVDAIGRGRPLEAGLYFACLEVAGRRMVRRFVVTH